MHRAVLILASVLLPLGLFAAERNLSADLPMEFDGIHNAVIARQNATFVDKELQVVADEIRYNKTEEKAYASGNVRLNYKGVRLVSQTATYDMKNHYFTAKDFRMGYFPYMISGEQIEGTSERITLHNATLCASQTGKMAPGVYASTMVLHPGQESTRVTLYSALAKLGPVPVFPIPYASANISSEQNLDLRATVGNSHNYGTFVRTETPYPITDSFSAGANLDYNSSRGFLYGPKASYRSDDISANLSSGFISDTGNRGVDIRGRPIGQDRGFVDFRYKQQLGPAEITAQTQYWSDSEILRDYRPNMYPNEQAPESFAEAVAPLPDSYASVFTRYNPNSFDNIPNTLPELRFDRLSTPVGDTGIYYSVFNSAAHIEEASLNYDRYDGIFTVNRPTAINEGWQVNPVAATRFTYYDNAVAGSPKSSYSRMLGEIGFDSQWSFYHIYEIKSDLWNIDGLKHTIQPILQYRYLPAAAAGAGQIPNMEGRVFDTNLRPTDFFYMADVDNLESLNLMRFGLKQALQTRNTTTGAFPTRDLMTLELYQDYNFTATADHPHFDSFYALSELNPNEWISLGIFARMNLESLTWQEDRLYTTLKDGDFRTLTFSTRYLQHNLNQYETIYTQKLTDRLSLFTTLTYDVRLHSFSDLIVGLSQRLRSGWEVMYGIEETTNDSRESGTRFTIHFHWLNG